MTTPPPREGEARLALASAPARFPLADGRTQDTGSPLERNPRAVELPRTARCRSTFRAREVKIVLVRVAAVASTADNVAALADLNACSRHLQPKSSRAEAPTCIRLAMLKMPRTTFCRDAFNELASLSPNDGWVRGAYAVCEMYGAADAGRFEIILRRLSLGTGGTALTEGARWLLARWQLAQTGHS